MKKLIILPITLALFAACTDMEPLPSESEKIVLDEANLQIERDKCSAAGIDEANCFAEIAKKNNDFFVCDFVVDENAKNTCLSIHLQNMLILDEITVNSKICTSFVNNPQFTSECFSSLAMKTKNVLFCDQASNPDECKAKLVYENAGAKWMLQNDWSDTGDRFINFEGSATITGFFNKAPRVGDSSLPYFMLSGGNGAKIPTQIQSTQFFLAKGVVDGVPDLYTMQELSTFPLHDSDRPLTIQVKGVIDTADQLPALVLTRKP